MIYRRPNLHLNANVAVLARNHGNEEHYNSSATIVRLCLVPSRERRDLPIQQVGEGQWAQWSCLPILPPPCAFGMLSSFPRDAGMVMDQAIGWDLLGTSPAKAINEGAREPLLILGRDSTCFPKVPAR